MSILSVNRLCRDVMRDKDFRKQVLDNPSLALDQYQHPLTAEEKKALLAGDATELFRLGVNDFLMGYLARFKVMGFDMETYGEKLRGAARPKG